MWQMIDCDRAIRAFAPKIFHVHFKDIKLLRDRLAEYGTMAYPLDIMVPKIPGLGDVDWAHSCLRLPRRALTVTLASRSKIALLSRAASACLRASNNPIGTCASL